MKQGIHFTLYKRMDWLAGIGFGSDLGIDIYQGFTKKFGRLGWRRMTLLHISFVFFFLFFLSSFGSGSLFVMIRCVDWYFSYWLS